MRTGPGWPAAPRPQPAARGRLECGAAGEGSGPALIAASWAPSRCSDTNYARIVHATSLDGRGYAFPYDDVAPTGGADQSGSVSSGSPAGLAITLGAVH